MYWAKWIAIAVLSIVTACDDGSDKGAGKGEVKPESGSAEVPSEVDRTEVEREDDGADPDPRTARAIYRGPAALDGDASLAYLMPGVYADIFPLDFGGERPANPLEVPEDIARRLRQITPEVLLWSPPPGIGIAVIRRGWHQEEVVSVGSCHIYFDYRVDVKDVNAPNSSKFGQTSTPVRWVKVFPPPAGETGLYVLIVTEVGINVDRVGEDFTETNTAIVQERQAAGQSITTTITRQFIVEHELAHAEQIREAFFDALMARVRTDQLCDPVRTTSQPTVRLENIDFPAAWASLESSGAGGSHSNAQYPDTPVETEARRQAWRLVQ
ncbi:MAG: hypothetical protein HUJ31_10590 [Pseudomonadales bacterium]|nr:hypothetical protein [Pseudomonadales bacterium]